MAWIENILTRLGWHKKTNWTRIDEAMTRQEYEADQLTDKLTNLWPTCDQLKGIRLVNFHFHKTMDFQLPEMAILNHCFFGRWTDRTTLLLIEMRICIETVKKDEKKTKKIFLNHLMSVVAFKKKIVFFFNFWKFSWRLYAWRACSRSTL